MSGDLLAEGTLPAAWARRWAERPDAPVVRDASTDWVCATEIEGRTTSVAGRLAGAGLLPGDRVLVAATASVDLVIAHIACLRAGLTVVPLNPAYRQPEIAHVVGDCKPALAIVDDPECASAVRQVSAIRVVDPTVPLPASTAPLPGEVAPGAPALIAYTSGTTGPPKGAVLSHANLLAGAEALRRAWEWTPDDRLVLALPLFHIHGLGAGLHGTLLAGASAVIQSRFDVDALADAIERESATLFFGVPTMYHRIVASPRARAWASLRLCVSGSAPLPASLFAQIVEACGQTPLERYGMTETIMLASNPYRGERRAGSVGFALPGVDLRLAEANHEIEVRGPNVFGGYLDAPDATAAAFGDDGWFRTGDLGEIDGDGYLHISGRAKDLVITGGYNVHPREVEDVLRTHPGVHDATVRGIPDDEWGEIVVAWIETADGQVTDLDGFLAERLAPYKRPRRIVTVDALPRNAMGKVEKHRLVEG